MIGKLQGIVDFIGENYAIIMCNGVGYRVFCPYGVLANLRGGEISTLWIETNVREDHIHLYGFDSRAAQDLFLRLTSVSGVGPKLAMAILGAFKADVLAGAIASGDVKTLTSAPGVGKKVAERIVVELKGKSGILNLESGISDDSSVLADLICALESLGYRRIDVVDMAQKLVRENPDTALSSLVSLALKGMAK